jgi:hypothetical protein
MKASGNLLDRKGGLLAQAHRYGQLAGVALAA